MAPSSIETLSHKDQVQFALFCAKQVIHLTGNPGAYECIRVVELWLEGKASVEDCGRAADTYYATTAAIYVAANAAIYAAACAANATYAPSAAYAAAYVVMRNAPIGCKIEQYLYELMHIDEIVEQTLLALS